MVKGKLYVVGDIHGSIEQLEEVLERIGKTKEEDKVIFLGDYVDRGLDSLKVLQRLVKYKEDHNCIFLMGNHDEEFIKTLHFFGNSTFNKEVLENMSLNGAMSVSQMLMFMCKYQQEAFKSFLDSEEDKAEFDKLIDFTYNNIGRMPTSDPKYLDFCLRLQRIVWKVNKYETELMFLDSCDYMLETDKYIISHSGGVKKPLESNSYVDWVWGRDYTKSPFTNKYFVVGHTPTQSKQVEIRHDIKHIFVDTGAVFYNVPIGLYESTYDYIEVKA